MMGASERDWVCILIMTNLRGCAGSVDAGQPRRSDEEDGERDSRSVASSADQPADGTRYEVVEGARVARLPHVCMFAPCPWSLDGDTPSPAGYETELAACRDGQKSRKRVAKCNSACTTRPARVSVISSPSPSNPGQDSRGRCMCGPRCGRRARVAACPRRGIKASALAQTQKREGRER